jgi:AcrR family transcriptional regulator
VSAGRPRDDAIDAAVIGAALGMLADRGYLGFALEAVAARAGTTKAAIRRRWPGRQELVIDALASVLVPLAPPDNGCTRCDLMDSVRLLAEVLRDRVPGRVLAPLVADCADDARLRARLIAALVAPSRDAAAVAVQRAVGRGDLRPDVDPALIVELLASVVYQRALLGGSPLGESEVGPLVDTVLRGVAVNFDRLVEISRKHRH